MEQRMITIYCLIEEFLKGVMGKEEHKLAEISDSFHYFNINKLLFRERGLV